MKKLDSRGFDVIRLVIIVLVLLVIGWVLWYFYSSGTDSRTRSNSNDSTSQQQANQNGSTMTPIPQNQEYAKVFDITAKNFEFSQKELRVKKGDKVRINLTSTEGVHTWDVEEFNAETERVSAGQSRSVEFTADKTGTFEYYCSVGNHRQMGMVGKLIVE